MLTNTWKCDITHNTHIKFTFRTENEPYLNCTLYTSGRVTVTAHNKYIHSNTHTRRNLCHCNVLIYRHELAFNFACSSIEHMCELPDKGNEFEMLREKKKTPTHICDWPSHSTKLRLKCKKEWIRSFFFVNCSLGSCFCSVLLFV